MVKRIMVTLDDEQYEIIKQLKGFGSKDAEIIRNIVISYLSEKSYLKLVREELKDIRLSLKGEKKE